MKKLVSLLLVAMMALSFIPAMADEPVEIVVACKSLGNGWPADLEDDFVYQKILEETGVAWKLILIDDYFAAMGQRIVGDDLPDVIYYSDSYLKTYADEEVLLCLDPYVEKELAPVMAWLGETNLIPYQVNGELYGLPKLHDGNKSQYNIQIRKDWLDNLGLAVPTTIEELYNVACKFITDDPDGNGAADTYGITGGKGLPLFHAISCAFDTALGNYILIRDGKVTNALLQPGMKNALEWCLKFTQTENMVDPDVLTTTGNNIAIAGSVGVHVNSWPGMFKQYAQDNIAAVNPNAKWIPAGPLHNEMGGEDVMYPINNVGGGDGWALCADLADDEEKLQAVFKVLNYFVTEEGSNLIQYGLEGEHWVKNPETGRISMTENGAAANYISTYQIFSRIELEYLQVKFPEAEIAFTNSMTKGVLEYYNSLVVEPDGMYLADMESYIKTQMLAFIYGERPLDEYDAFIKELNDNYMFAEYMEAAADQLISFGYDVTK